MLSNFKLAIDFYHRRIVLSDISLQPNDSASYHLPASSVVCDCLHRKIKIKIIMEQKINDIERSRLYDWKGWRDKGFPFIKTFNKKKKNQNQLLKTKSTLKSTPQTEFHHYNGCYKINNNNNK